MTNKEIIEAAVGEIVKKYSQIKLVYLFGSKANETAGPLSDYDIAVYLDETDKMRRFDIKLDSETVLAKELKTDKIDVVVIYEEEPYKMLIEPGILNEYFDFRQSLRQFGLTKT